MRLSLPASPMAMENLKMISDSVKYLRSKGKEVFYDAEHFFDGYIHNADYAKETIIAAREAGASVIVLCDTNGGTITSEVFKIVQEVRELPGVEDLIGTKPPAACSGDTEFHLLQLAGGMGIRAGRESDTILFNV